MPLTYIVAIIGAILIGYLAIRVTILEKKYKGIIDIDKEIKKRNKEKTKIEKNTKTLKDNYDIKKEVFDKLEKEIELFEEELEISSYGLYKPYYSFDTSEHYKEELEKVNKKQRELIKDKEAIECSTEWSVGDSKREGRKMINRIMKLMMRAFNNECDTAILKVRWNNATKMEERIRKSFEAINKIGEVSHIEISEEYLELKLEELRLNYEYQEKKYEEKEEQRRIRIAMREEEKAQREFEKAQKEAENEEEKYEKALEKARKEVQNKEGAKRELLEEKIKELEGALENAHTTKERVIARAQLTKSGYVYVISNVGSFGENIYKIGMTRRLDPDDRIKELGDASVPFLFDVHAMMYSENAPDLEAKLHKKFDGERLNMVNTRKEFFNVPLKEIEKVAKKEGASVEFTMVAEAKEYKETLEMKKKSASKKKEETKFPSAL